MSSDADRTRRPGSPESRLPDTTPPRSPVRLIPTDDPKEGLSGTALCLSGGGYRAMLFHLGSVWRLFDAGWLTRIDRVSSVSGGSITAGVLALAWSRLADATPGDRAVFESNIVSPLRSVARRTIDWPSILRGCFIPAWISRRVAGAYRKHLFGDATLQDLPDKPRFVFNATNLQSGVLWRFSKPYMADYRVGKVDRPRVPIATAVAASSAFPPILSPTVLHFAPEEVKSMRGVDLHRPPFTTRAVLADGGVYDNLGLETAWKKHKTLLVSDAGGAFSAQERPWLIWIGQVLRVLMTIDNQVRSLRKRMLIEAISRTNKDDEHDGAYWGIGSEMSGYSAHDVLPCDPTRALELARRPTRLAGVPEEFQERLINWGYALCDAALRTYVDASIPAARAFPYERGV